MFGWLPKKFSIRCLLFFVALIACALAAGLEWSRWNSAHEHYERTLAAWHVGNLKTSDVIAEADALFNAELGTLWMPRSAARRRHAERLSELADDVEARARVTIWGSSEALQQQHEAAEQLRVRVAQLSAP
jgi:hypothetical protein